MLFSTTDLLNVFIKWLYDKFIKPPATGLHEGYGENWLYENHSSFVGTLNTDINGYQFKDLKFTLGNGTGTDGIVLAKFDTIEKVLAAEYTNFYTANPNLAQICVKLNTLTAENKAFSWFANETALINKIAYAFKNSHYDANQETFIRFLVDHLVELYKPLSYFSTYLNKHLTNDLSKDNLATEELTVDSASKNEAVVAAKSHIRDKVQTSLVLSTNKQDITTNADYQGLDLYLHHAMQKLNRSDAMNVIAPTKVLAEIVHGVSSATLFKEYTKYEDAKTKYEDAKEANNGNVEDLFKVSENVKFLKLSGLVDDADRIKVSWDDFKSWLFGTSHSDENLIKGFVRTQLYRPLFFKHNDYVNFSSNTSAYICKTQKSYINHDGVEKSLVFTGDLGGSTFSINLSASSLVAPSGAGYQITNVKYSKITNVLQYSIKHDTIVVASNKFVYSDIQFFVAVIDSKVNAVYFNEF